MISTLIFKYTQLLTLISILYLPVRSKQLHPLCTVRAVRVSESCVWTARNCRKSNPSCTEKYQDLTAVTGIVCWNIYCLLVSLQDKASQQEHCGGCLCHKLLLIALKLRALKSSCVQSLVCKWNGTFKCVNSTVLYTALSGFSFWQFRQPLPQSQAFGLQPLSPVTLGKEKILTEKVSEWENGTETTDIISLHSFNLLAWYSLHHQLL